MHEFSLAAALVEQLQRIADEQHARRIVEVEVHCGVMQQVVNEALEVAFAAASAETPAAGARLKIVTDELVVRCRACGNSFAAAIDNYACPQCRTADVEVVAGRDVVLQSVICDV
jgi:hydrogenase nickel incorporation protein HypA/HybF